MKPVFRSNFFAMMIVLLMSFGTFAVGPVIRMLDLPGQASSVLYEVLFLIVPTIIYFALTRLPVKETLRLNKIGLSTVLISVLIGILVFPMASFLGSLSQIFFHNFLQDAFEQMKSFSLVSFLGVVALTPAICEEVAMRGVLLSGYRNIDMRKAAFMNGLFFGILHMNPQQFFYAFAIGIIFAYMVYAANSIFASMICHFTCNGISVVLNYLVMQAAANQGLKITDMAEVPSNIRIASLLMQFVVFIICLTCIVILIRSIKNITSKASPAQGFSSNTGAVLPLEAERVLNWPLYVTLSAYIFFIILFQLITKVSMLN